MHISLVMCLIDIFVTVSLQTDMAWI